MATGADLFHQAFGDPDPETSDGLPENIARPRWSRWRPTVKSGWFAGRFLYLFGPGLEQLHQCLGAWPEIVPPRHPKRIILGYNAYGAIIVYEDTDDLDNVMILDPLRRRYFKDPSLNFSSLIATWLPDRRIPDFFDTSVYDAWLKAHGAWLNAWEILGIQTSLDAGGQMQLDNFRVENIVQYHASKGAGD